MNKEKTAAQDEAMRQMILDAVRSGGQAKKVSIVQVYSFLLAAIVCLGLLVFALTWGINSWNAPTGLQQTQGRVVSITRRGVKSPIVEYQVDGETYNTSGSVSVVLSRLSIGEPVTVLYSHGNPEQGTV